MTVFGLLLVLTVGVATPAPPTGVCTISNLAEAISVPLPQNRTCRFRARGQILALDGDTLLLKDNACGAIIGLPSTPIPQMKIGDLVEIEGVCRDNELNRRSLMADTVKVTGTKPVTAPRDIDGALLASGQHNYTLVRIHGVIAATIRDELDSRWNWFVLRSDSGSANVAVPEETIPLARLRALTDAEASVTGVAVPLTNWRANRGSHLQVVTSNALEVVSSPPSDPFHVPSLGDGPSTHRQKTSGVVLAISKDRLFLRTKQHTLLPICPMEGILPPSPGSIVEVSGFPQQTTDGYLLFDALLRPSGKDPVALDTPADISPEDLFTDPTGVNKITARNNGRVIRLRATIASRPNDDGEPSRIVLDCETHSLVLDLSALPDVSSLDLAPGCRVEATGLCIASFQEDVLRMGFPHFNGFIVIPRSISDLRVLARPPWWTPLRLFIFICILLVALVVTLIWNRLLQTLSERRGRELYREKVAHTRTELKVEERTRLAVELHDSISQTLAGVALQIDSANRSEENHGASNPFLNTARQMLASCRSELQSCLWDLRSRTFEERDMTEAIERAVSPHTGSAKVSVRFNGPREQLLETTTHAILRIVRELVSNAVRHGHASSVRIAGEHHGDTVSFSVTDDGCGFDVREAPGPLQGHFGLQGIRERLKPYKGSINIESAPGKGTRTTVRMVISEMNEDEEED